MKRISALLGGAVLSVAILAACGGGGGGSGTSAPGGPIPPGTPTSAPTLAPSQSFTSSDAVAIPTAAPGAATVAVPLAHDASGASANAAISSSASVPPDTTVAATFSSTADPSLATLSRRSPGSVRNLREDGKKNVIAYLRLQFSADVSLPQAPAFTFVVPGTLPTTGITYWLAFIDPLRSAAGWQLGFEGPAAVTPATTSGGKAGTQLAFASNGQPLTFVANQTYYFAVYAVGATVATPTPVPSTVPSNPPPDGKPAPVLVTPANVQFASVTSSPVPITFSQQGFTGAFTLHGDCTGIVNTSGASPTWTLTPVGQGRCVVVGLGDKGATAVVHIGVVTQFETPRPSPTPHPSTSPTTSPSHSPEPEHSESPEPEHSATPHPSTSPTTSPSHSPEPEHSATPHPSTSPTTSPSHSPEPEHSPTPAPSQTPTPGTHN